jgi:hypothetical protein
LDVPPDEKTCGHASNKNITTTTTTTTIYIYIYISGGNFDDETIVYMNDYVCVKIVSIISKSAFSPILYK